MSGQKKNNIYLYSPLFLVFSLQTLWYLFRWLNIEYDNTLLYPFLVTHTKESNTNGKNTKLQRAKIPKYKKSRNWNNFGPEQLVSTTSELSFFLKKDHPSGWYNKTLQTE